MNNKFWIKKIISMCLTVVLIATYSMTTAASSEKIAGEVLVSGKTVFGQKLFVKINGENAQSGRSLFTGSTISTPENTNAIVNLGKAGTVELSPNTIINLTFNENDITGNLSAGRITVLNSLNVVRVETSEGKTATILKGESANASGAKTQIDDEGGSNLLIYAIILGGAVAGIIYAATSENKIALGGGSTVVSTTR